MIKTVYELQKYILQDAADVDEYIFKRRHLMTSPGCSKERLLDLKVALPGIPDSYIKWVGAFNLNGVLIGYFEVSPGSFHDEDIYNTKDVPEKYIYRLAKTLNNFWLLRATSTSFIEKSKMTTPIRKKRN